MQTIHWLVIFEPVLDKHRDRLVVDQIGKGS